MVPARLWLQQEDDLFIYGYLHCPFSGSLTKRAEWLRDYLHTMTGTLHRNIQDIMDHVRYLQEQGLLPPNWMKLPGQYTRDDISNIQDAMYVGLMDHDYGPTDRYMDVGLTYCQVAPDDTPEICRERLVWLLTDHLRGPGGFRLWSDEMCAAINKLYLATSSPAGCRKFSNEHIEKDPTVCDAAWETFPPPDHTSLQLHYYFLNGIVKGDTSTRRKRLQYYYSDRLQQPPRTVLDYYRSPLRLQFEKRPLQWSSSSAESSQATAIDLTSPGSRLITPPHSGNSQPPMMPQRSTGTKIAVADATNPQIPCTFPAHIPARQRENYDFPNADLVDPNSFVPARVPASDSLHGSCDGHQREILEANTGVIPTNSPRVNFYARPMPAGQDIRATSRQPMPPPGLQRPLRNLGSPLVISQPPVGQGVRKSLPRSASRPTARTVVGTHQKVVIPKLPRRRLSVVSSDTNQQNVLNDVAGTSVLAQAGSMLAPDQGTIHAFDRITYEHKQTPSQVKLFMGITMVSASL